MHIPSSLDQADSGVNRLPMRPAGQVMQLERLGSFHQSRLSFMRTLVRRMVVEDWQINSPVFDLDEHGYGTVVYQIEAKYGTFSYVVFSHYLDPERRNDRVIADQWDLTTDSKDLTRGRSAQVIFPSRTPNLQVESCMRESAEFEVARRVSSSFSIISLALRSCAMLCRGSRNRIPIRLTNPLLGMLFCIFVSGALLHLMNVLLQLLKNRSQYSHPSHQTSA